MRFEIQVEPDETKPNFTGMTQHDTADVSTSLGSRGNWQNREPAATISLPYYDVYIRGGPKLYAALSNQNAEEALKIGIKILFEHFAKNHAAGIKFLEKTRKTGYIDGRNTLRQDIKNLLAPEW